MSEPKYILGINGWNDSSHDASAVLLAAGKENTTILAGLEEDKVLGKKGLYDVFPVNAIQEILNLTNLKSQDISAVVFGWDYPKAYRISGRDSCLTSAEILRELFPETKNLSIPIYYVDHHLSHANSSHYLSNFDESISLVVDGSGEDDSTSLWHYKRGDKELVEKFDPISSFGFLFEAVNLMLGFRENESGKTMGLAGYGKPVYAGKLLEYFDDSLGASQSLRKIYQRFLSLRNTDFLLPYQEVTIKSWLYIFQYILKIEKNDNKLSSFYDFPRELKNLAASAQAVLEEKVLKYISAKCRELGVSNVSMSGGVALNCILNGKILALDEVKNIFVQPAAGDSGVALGGALEYCKEKGYSYKITDFTPYIGREYSDKEVKRYLDNHQIPYTLVEDASSFIAKKLLDNNVLAVFQGKNEWGPRALGNRTILSLPVEGQLDYINKEVKNRELGRPLAPSMLKEDIFQIITYPPKVYGKYMNIAFESDKKVKGVESIIHVDNTFRPQCLADNDNPVFQSQLECLKDLRGSSIVINTSFNGKTPIIYSLNQAIDFLVTRSLDYLVFNNKFILRKEDMV